MIRLYVSSCTTCGNIGRLIKKLRKQQKNIQIIETKFSVQQREYHKEYAHDLQLEGLPPIVVIDSKPQLLSEYLSEQACDFC